MNSKPMIARQQRARDGRNVAPELGMLAGEAAAMTTTHHPDAYFPAPRDVYRDVPSRGGAQDEHDPTYYDTPAVKEPTWIWTVPLYFWAGGVTGATGVLSAVAQWTRDPKLARLTRWVNWLGAGMNAFGSAMLIADLGVKRRFLNMLRVFRPTSAMSVGSWTLVFSSTLHGIAAIFGMGSGRRARAAARGASYAAGACDVPLSGYTGVLLTETTIPAWRGARHTLPALFVASSAASAGSMLDLLPFEEDELRIARTFATVGKAAELVLMHAVEREVGTTPRVARPYHEGRSGTLWNAAKLLNAASLVLGLLPGDSRGKRLTTGLLGTAGALTLRYAVLDVGRASARDPRAAFEQQRHERRRLSERAAGAGARTRPLSKQHAARNRSDTA